MVEYIVTAGWTEGREDCYQDDNLKVETTNLNEASMAYHDIWFPDMRSEYYDCWESFCYADEPECWKNLEVKQDGETVYSVTEYEKDEERERKRLYDIEQEIESVLRNA